MKKKIALALSMVLMVLVLGACGKKDPSAVDYNGTSYKELEQQMQENIAMVQAILQFYSENNLTAETVTDDVKEYLYSVGVTDAQIAAADRWDEIEKEFGKADAALSQEISMKSFGQDAYHRPFYKI